MTMNLKPIRFLLPLLLCFSVSLSLFSKENEPEFKIINAANGLADNSAQVIVCTRTGRMIISTIGNLNFYDGSSFTHIDTEQEYQYDLPAYRGNDRIYFDHNHHIWLKSKNSVTCVDLLMETFIPDVAGVIREMGCDEKLLDLFTDNEGHAYFLTEKGLYDVDAKKTHQVLKDRNLQDIDLYKGMLLMFYDNGEVIGLNREDGQIAHRSKAFEWEMSHQFTQSTIIQQYKESYFVIHSGTEGSVLMQLDMVSGQWKTILQVPYGLNGMTMRNDCLYIASAKGYWTYDIPTQTTNHVELVKLRNGKYLQTVCHTIVFDRQGGLWLGTEKRGVLYATPYSSPFNVYMLDSPEAEEYISMMEPLKQNIFDFNGKQANCMFEDSRGYSWIGTTVGLYMFRKAQSEPVIFSKKNGLLNNFIHSVVEDKQHNIWVSTSYGISCIIFDKDNPDFVNSFSLSDNVPNDAFLNCKAMCLNDSTIIMQAVDHVVSFNPNHFAAVNVKSPVVLYPKLIRILVNGDFVSAGEEKDGIVIIDRAITRIKDINLNADQNSVSLTFSGLNYFRPLQTYYRVRLLGMGDEKWHVYSYFNGSDVVDTKGNLHLPLMNLTPGEYQIEVQASMFPDQWSGTTPFTWIVHVNQPWWQATGVYVLFVLLILILVVVNLYFFSRNTKMRARRNSEEDDIIKKVNAFVDKSVAISNELIAPQSDELFFAKHDNSTPLSPEFSALMIKLIPYVQAHKGRVTMRELSNASDTDIVTLYHLISANIFKSPRELALKFALQTAAHMLVTTDKSIEEIADECHFYTPNYFMGSFFHEYKRTPSEYRKELR